MMRMDTLIWPFGYVVGRPIKHGWMREKGLFYVHRRQLMLKNRMGYKGLALWPSNDKDVGDDDDLGRSQSPCSDKEVIGDCGFRGQEVFWSANKAAPDVDNGNEIGSATERKALTVGTDGLLLSRKIAAAAVDEKAAAIVVTTDWPFGASKSTAPTITRGKCLVGYNRLRWMSLLPVPFFYSSCLSECVDISNRCWLALAAWVVYIGQVSSAQPRVLLILSAAVVVATWRGIQLAGSTFVTL